MCADRRYFVIELKYHRRGERSARALLEEASAQIAANHYGEHNYPELPHIRIASVFSQQERGSSLRKVFWSFNKPKLTAFFGDPANFQTVTCGLYFCSVGGIMPLKK